MGELPPTYMRYFNLPKVDRGKVLWHSPVMKLNRRHKHDPRYGVITDTGLFICKPKGISRSLSIEKLRLIDDPRCRNMVALRVEGEHDCVFEIDNEQQLTEVVNALDKSYSAQTGEREMPRETVTGKLQDNLNLTRKKGYVNDPEGGVRKRPSFVPPPPAKTSPPTRPADGPPKKARPPPLGSDQHVPGAGAAPAVPPPRTPEGNPPPGFPSEHRKGEAASSKPEAAPHPAPKTPPTAPQSLQSLQRKGELTTSKPGVPFPAPTQPVPKTPPTVPSHAPPAAYDYRATTVAHPTPSQPPMTSLVGRGRGRGLRLGLQSPPKPDPANFQHVYYHRPVSPPVQQVFPPEPPYIDQPYPMNPPAQLWVGGGAEVPWPMSHTSTSSTRPVKHSELRSLSPPRRQVTSPPPYYEPAHPSMMSPTGESRVEMLRRGLSTNPPPPPPPMWSAPAQEQPGPWVPGEPRIVIV